MESGGSASAKFIVETNLGRPLLTTSTINFWLLIPLFSGIKRLKSDVNSTNPDEFNLANFKSVIVLLIANAGLTANLTLPVIFSYLPTGPKILPAA